MTNFEAKREKLMDVEIALYEASKVFSASNYYWDKLSHMQIEIRNLARELTESALSGIAHDFECSRMSLEEAERQGAEVFKAYLNGFNR